MLSAPAPSLWLSLLCSPAAAYEAETRVLGSITVNTSTVKSPVRATMDEASDEVLKRMKIEKKNEFNFDFVTSLIVCCALFQTGRSIRLVNRYVCTY